MFCDKCGKQNLENTRFCSSCGHAIGSSMASEIGVRAASEMRRHTTSFINTFFSGFDVMVIPRIITLVYKLILTLALLSAIVGILMSLYLAADANGGESLLILLVGILGNIIVTICWIVFARFICELTIVQFKIHEALQDIREQTVK